MEAVPVLASGVFAGAALGVTIAEHPARKDIDPQEAVKQFRKSYKRLAISQVSLALIAGTSALYLATQSTNKSARATYAAGSAAMLGMLPFTAVFLIPTNDRLCSAEKKENAEVKELFDKWEKLHAVRTVASILAFAGMTVAVVCAKK